MEEVKMNESVKLTEAEQTDPAKAPFGSAILPWGLVGDDGVLHKNFEVRELTGYEEDILASRKMNVLARMQKIMERCVVKIGPYSQSDKEWSRYILSLSVADRLFILREIRIVSLGEHLKYNILCPKCEKKGTYSFNLMDISFRTPEKIQRVWEGKLPRSGKSYMAKIQTGIEEQKVQEHLSGNDALTVGIWCRLVELDGKNPVPFGEVKKLGTFDRDFLRSEFKNYEVQVDSEVEMECQFCGQEFKEDIDMGQVSFFFPTAMSK